MGGPYETYLITVLVAVELLIVVYKKQRNAYHWQDAFNSISCGMINALSRYFFVWFATVPYEAIHQRWGLSLFDPNSVSSFIVVLLGVDCAYYWAHRELHLYNIGWAGHATHHSSEYLNLSTAARQSVMGHVLGSWFYLPLALFFPTSLYLKHLAINLFYQLFIHTELIGKLHPAYEYIFNTPSHHRVHHASNPEYLDKNFAGMLIIWDRIFGTFCEEKTIPVYGLTHPLRNWDMIWAQFHHLVYIFRECSKLTKIRNMIATVFAPTGMTVNESTNKWTPSDIPSVDPSQPRFKTNIPSQIMIYILTRFVVTVAFYQPILYGEFPALDTTLLSCYIVFSLESYSVMMNRSPNAFNIELIRTLLDPFVLAYYIKSMLPLSCLVMLHLLSIGWLFHLRDAFTEHSEPAKAISTGERDAAIATATTTARTTATTTARTTATTTATTEHFDGSGPEHASIRARVQLGAATS